MSAVPFVIHTHRHKFEKPNTQKSSFAQFYTKFRASKVFLGGLCAVVATWLGLHFTFGLDHDLGGINLFLSAEASISLAFFTIMAEMQDKQNLELEYDQEEKLDEILEVLEEHDAVHEGKSEQV